MNTKNEFDEEAFNKEIEENEPIDINECFERLHDKDVTELKLQYAIDYVVDLMENYGEHFIKYGKDTKLVTLEFCTDDEEMQHPFDCTAEEFENDLSVRLKTYCTFFDYIIHTETYRKRYQSRYKNNFMPHCFEDGALMKNAFVPGFDAIYRSLHEEDGFLIPAFKRQYDKIEPEKRSFVFYMLHKYMNNIFSDMENRLQYCLLAVCNGIEEREDFPENFSVDIDTGVLHSEEEEDEFTMKRRDLPLDVPAFETW